MIRTKLINEIKDILNDHVKFSLTDFSIELKNRTIIIFYEYDNAFYYQAEIPNSPSVKTLTKKNSFLPNRNVETDYEVEVYNINAVLCPGEMSLKETQHFEGKKELLKRIRSWQDNLWEELISIPVQKEMEKQEIIINELKQKVKDLPDTFFTEEEGEDIKKKLQDLEDSLTERIEKEIKDKNELEKSINELHLEIESLKETVYSLNKQNWFKSAIAKTYNWLSKDKNRKLLIEGTKLLKPMLPDGIKDIVE